MSNVMKNPMKYYWLTYRYYIIIIFCSIITLICGTLTLIFLKIYDLGIVLIVFGLIQLICGFSLIIIKYFKVRKSNSCARNMCAYNCHHQNETAINSEIIAHQNDVFEL
jgi:hypothetical protein